MRIRQIGMFALLRLAGCAVAVCLFCFSACVYAGTAAPPTRGGSATDRLFALWTWDSGGWDFHGAEPQVQALLKQGADPNTMRTLHRMKDGKPDSVQATPLMAACVVGEVRVVSDMIAAGANVNRRTSGGDTALSVCVAAQSRNAVEIAGVLIDHGAKVNTVVDNGETPLNDAITLGEQSMASLLIDHGADLNHGAGTDGTPLMTASAFGERAIVEKLLEHHVNVNATDKNGDTALLINATVDTPSVIDILARHGADVNVRLDNNESILMHAVDEGETDKVAALLKAGADPNRVSKLGTTALALARSYEYDDIIKLLVDAGAKR